MTPFASGICDVMRPATHGVAPTLKATTATIT
jgi:hypothetical protein